MPTTYAFIAAKGGQGTTVTAVATALAFASANVRTLLIDAAERHDCHAVLGLPQPSDPDATTDAGTRLDVIADAVVADVDPSRYDAVIIDAGQRTELAETADATVLVTRPCYLALRHALASPVRPSTIVVITEAGRSLNTADIAAVLAVDHIITIRHDPAVARAVDAGLLAARTPSVLAPVADLLVPTPN